MSTILGVMQNAAGGDSARQSSTSAPAKSVAEERQAIDQMQVFAEKALERFRAGSPDAWRRVVRAVDCAVPSAERTSEQNLRRWLLALASTASLLKLPRDEAAVSALVTAARNFDWTLERPTCAAFRQLLLNLLTTNFVDLQGTVSSVVARAMTLEQHTPRPECGPTGDAREDERLMEAAWRATFASARFPLACEQAVTTAAHLVALCPAFGSSLKRAMRAACPFRRRLLESHVAFARNALALAKRCGPLRCDLFVLLVEKCVEMDVSVDPVPLLRYVRSEAARSDTCMRDSDSEEDGATDDADDPDGDSESERLERHVALTAKIDAVMCLLLDFLKQRSARQRASGEELSSADRDPLSSMFAALLLSFESALLNARAHFAPQLVFYATHLRVVFAETFAAQLFHACTTVTTPLQQRLHACAFLGGFLSRASFLRHATVQIHVQHLVHWMHEYVRYHQISGCSGRLVDAMQVAKLAQKHVWFYGVMQTVMQVVAARVDVLRQQQDDVVAEGGLESWHLDMLINSSLRPVQVCSRDVVVPFLRVYERLQLGALPASAMTAVQDESEGRRRLAETHAAEWPCEFPLQRQQDEAAVASVDCSKFALQLRVLRGFRPFGRLLLRLSGDYVAPLCCWPSARTSARSNDDAIMERCLGVHTEARQLGLSRQQNATCLVPEEDAGGVILYRESSANMDAAVSRAMPSPMVRAVSASPMSPAFMSPTLSANAGELGGNFVLGAGLALSGSTSSGSRSMLH